MIEHNLSHQLCSRPDISTDTDCDHHSCYKGRYIILFSPVLLNAVTERAFVRVYYAIFFLIDVILNFALYLKNKSLKTFVHRFRIFDVANFGTNSSILQCKQAEPASNHFKFYYYLLF